MKWLRLTLLSCATAWAAVAQTPLLLVNGYQLFCGPGGSGTFGAAVSILNGLGYSATSYDTCTCQQCSIEDHAARIGQLIDGLEKGQGVDVIASSMGGLILRSYLAGKTSAGFQPPVDVKVRKAVFIATPHFGLQAPELDARLTAMQLGSRFVWDLATWNQNRDDLRGVDAIAIVGSGGTSGRDDGLVPLTSASLAFAADPARTRIIPYCHSESIPFVVDCRPNAAPIGRIDSVNHPTLRIILSFLSGTQEWRSIGTDPSGNDVLKNQGGLVTLLLDAGRNVPPVSGVQATGQADPGLRYTFGTQGNRIYFRELMQAQPYSVAFQNTELVPTIQVPAGGMRARLVKLPPRIDGVSGSAAALPFLSMAPCMIVSLYGVDLAFNGSTSISLDGQILPVLYASGTQVNVVLPANKLGSATLTVQNARGTDSVRVVLERSVPTLFSLAATGTGPAAARDAVTGALISAASPAVPGQLIALYGTGLGETTRQAGLDRAVITPFLTIGGVPARILYAGRAPGYPGLDQINVEVPQVRGEAVPVVISGARRTGNVVTLTIR